MRSDRPPRTPGEAPPTPAPTGCHDVRAHARDEGTRPDGAGRRTAVQDGVLLIDKPAGKTSHDIVAAVRREHRGRRVGHAGTLDPFATGLLLVLVGRATRIQRYLMALPKRYETVARLGATSTTGDPEGEITITGRIPPDPPPLPTGELLPAPARLQRGEGRRPARLRAGARRARRRARRAPGAPSTRFEQLWREERPRGVRDRVLGRDLRARARRRPRRRLLRGAAAHGDRPVRARRRRSRAGSCGSPTRSAGSCPRVRLDGDDARRAGARRRGRRRRRRRARPTCCCSTPTARSRSPSRGTRA